MNASFHFLIG